MVDLSLKRIVDNCHWSEGLALETRVRCLHTSMQVVARRRGGWEMPVWVKRRGSSPPIPTMLPTISTHISTNSTPASPACPLHRATSLTENQAAKQEQVHELISGAGNFVFGNVTGYGRPACSTIDCRQQPLVTKESSNQVTKEPRNQGTMATVDGLVMYIH